MKNFLITILSSQKKNEQFEIFIIKFYFIMFSNVSLLTNFILIFVDAKKL